MPTGRTENPLAVVDTGSGPPTLEVVSVQPHRVVVRLRVSPTLHQPYGIVHGGAYAAVAEFAAQRGGQAFLDEHEHEQERQREHGGGAGPKASTAGLQARPTAVSTQFLRATRDGVVTVEATAVHRGRSQQLWQVRMVTTNELGSADRVVAVADVRLRNERR